MSCSEFVYIWTPCLTWDCATNDFDFLSKNNFILARASRSAMQQTWNYSLFHFWLCTHLPAHIPPCGIALETSDENLLSIQVDWTSTAPIDSPLLAQRIQPGIKLENTLWIEEATTFSLPFEWRGVLSWKCDNNTFPSRKKIASGVAHISLAENTFQKKGGKVSEELLPISSPENKSQDGQLMIPL